MCHYLGGGLHGKRKRVKAQSESSKSVVNSVLISREMPVFPGFLEIIRVVDYNNKIKNSTIAGIINANGADTTKGFYEKHPVFCSVLISFLVGLILLFSFWDQVISFIEGLF